MISSRWKRPFIVLSGTNASGQTFTRPVLSLIGAYILHTTSRYVQTTDKDMWQATHGARARGHTHNLEALNVQPVAARAARQGEKPNLDSADYIS